MTTVKIIDQAINSAKLANELVVESGETTTASDTNIFTGLNMMKRLPFGARIHIGDIGKTTDNNVNATIEHSVETIWKINTAIKNGLSNNTTVEINITNTTGYTTNLNNYTVSLTYEAPIYGDAQLVDDLRPPVVYNKSENEFWIKVEEAGDVQDVYLNIMIFPGVN